MTYILNITHTILSNSTYYATVDIYDVNTESWNSTSTGAGQLSVARAYLVAAAAGNKIVFASGMYVYRCMRLTH